MGGGIPDKQEGFVMKKWIAVVLAMALLTVCLAACSSDDSGKKTFTVGFDANFPPYGYVGEDGEYTGFDLELAAEVAKRNGWELKLQAIDWDGKDFELDSGTIDCIWNGFTMNGREDGYTWTDPYMDNRQIVVVKASSGITTFADLAGKVVTAQADSAALNDLQSEKGHKALADTFKELVVCSQYNAAFMDLEAGAVDAIAMDEGVANYQISGRESEFVILEEVLVDEQYGIGFKKGNTELRDQVQKTLLEMVEDGTFATISKKWFDGRDVGTLGK